VEELPQEMPSVGFEVLFQILQSDFELLSIVIDHSRSEHFSRHPIVVLAFIVCLVDLAVRVVEQSLMVSIVQFLPRELHLWEKDVR